MKYHKISIDGKILVWLVALWVAVVLGLVAIILGRDFRAAATRDGVRIEARPADGATQPPRAP